MMTTTTETTFHHRTCAQVARLDFWHGKWELMVTCSSCGGGAPAAALLDPSILAPAEPPRRRGVGAVPPAPRSPHLNGWPTHRAKRRKAAARSRNTK